MTKKHDRSGDRVVLTYVYLNKAAHKALSQGEADGDGSLYNFMLAILAAAEGKPCYKLAYAVPLPGN